MNLTDLENKSVYIIREVQSRFKKPAVLFSAGKDSTVLLHLIKSACYDTVPFPVIHIDTTFKFPEMYMFRDVIAKDWNLDLKIAKNDKALAEGMCHEKGREMCCHALKTQALQQIIKEDGYDAILLGIRRDEHGVRNKEHYFSPRDKDFKWNYAKENKGGDSGLESLQDCEFEGWNIFSTDFDGADHVRVHPLLHWDEQDIWAYINKYKLPVNPLYFANNGKRYRSLGCACCTTPIDSNADTIKGFVDEIKANLSGERSGRNLDKEQIMEKLRRLGYM